ncbi:MAG: hypothetical protein ACREUG_09245 [Steroidobacteraceae bacterium]
MHTTHTERGHAAAAAAAALAASASLSERSGVPHFRYDFEFLMPRDARAVIELREAIALERARFFEQFQRLGLGRADVRQLIVLERELAAIPRESAWRDGFVNTVVTVGKDYLLDTIFAGSAYTAAWYLSLISITSYSAIAAADTMASHAGWTESSAYSNSTRPAPAFSAAAAGSKATSAAVVFNINAGDTIKGGFTSTNNAKAGATGTLYSAGLFTGGDQPVSSGGTLNVSLTLSV